jgi:hypothetical protein
MYIYNVTVSIDPDIADEWLEWMQKEHIPEVLQTGKFTGYGMLKILSTEEEEGITYSIQYKYSNPEDYERYKNEHAPTLQKKASDRFGGKFVAFRTLLQIVS